MLILAVGQHHGENKKTGIMIIAICDHRGVG